MAQLDKRALDAFINANVAALTRKFVVGDGEGGEGGGGGMALDGVTRADADRALQELHGRLGKVWKPFFAPARRKLLAENLRLIGATFVRASGATAQSAGRAGAGGDAALEGRVRELEGKLRAVKARRATLRTLVGMAERLDRDALAEPLALPGSRLATALQESRELVEQLHARLGRPPSLDATQGQILNQSPTDAT